jgi:hypothetical protein
MALVLAKLLDFSSLLVVTERRKRGPRLQNGFLPIKMCTRLQSRCANLKGASIRLAAETSRPLTC